MIQKLKRPYGFVGFEKFLCQCYPRKSMARNGKYERRLEMG